MPLLPRLITRKILLVFVFFSLLSALQIAGAGQINAVIDISHYYLDSSKDTFPFHYLRGHKAKPNWGTLYNCDLSNVNLLVFIDCHPLVPYSDREITFAQNFAKNGGTVLILGRSGKNPQNDLARKFGARFAGEAKTPFFPTTFLPEYTRIIGRNASFIKLEDDSSWEILVIDKKNAPLFVRKKIGNGWLIVGATELISKDKTPTNASWLTPLLEEACMQKSVDPFLPIGNRDITDMGNFKTLDNIDYHYPDHFADIFKSLSTLHRKCKTAADMVIPVEAYEKEPHYIISLTSSATVCWVGEYLIATGAFWDGYPKNDFRMTEQLINRMMRPRLLPHREVLRDPLVSYATLQAMSTIGHKRYAVDEIAKMIQKARRFGKRMDDYDLTSNPRETYGPQDTMEYYLHTGKSYAIFEELRKMDSQFLAKYVQMKRKVVSEQEYTEYGLSDMVAVMSKALKRNLFPLFKKYGQNVSTDKVNIKITLPEN